MKALSYEEELIFNYQTPFPMHLQWFAAEDEGRTEDPTEQKIKKAREEGKVAKSAELVTALVVLLPIATVGLLAGKFLDLMKEMMIFFFSNLATVNPAETRLLVPVFFNYFIRVTAPVAGVAFLAAILGNLFQVGFLFTTKTITPDFQKVAPDFIKYFSKTLFSLEGAYNLAKSILKIGIIGLVAYLNVKAIVPELVFLVNKSVAESFLLIARTAFILMIEAAAIMLVLSIPDYMFQRRQHRETLKMSKHEIKEEFKQMEGDPQVKSRLRQKMNDILSSTMIQNVPKADVVITNPTHFAVALEYNRSSMMAPQVTAKGQDNIALTIKRIAKDNSVPVVENRPLARGLHADAEIGDMIPEKYWSVVATILAEVKKFDENYKE